MKTIDSNDSAYPHEPYKSNQGLTKRELIAAMAMQAALTTRLMYKVDPELVAKFAICHADALLKELQK